MNEKTIEMCLLHNWFFIKFRAEIIKTLNYGITIRRILENQDG